MNKERYKEKYKEESNLPWPSDKEDKVTRKFYRGLSRLTKSKPSNNKNRLNFFELVLSIIKLKKF